MDSTGPLGIEPVEDQKYTARTIRCGPFFLPGRDSFPLQSPFVQIIHSPQDCPCGFWCLLRSLPRFRVP